MKRGQRRKIIDKSIENTGLWRSYTKKEIENILFSGFNLKWHQKIYIRICAKINGLFSGLWKYKSY